MDDGFLEKLNFGDAAQLVKCMNNAHYSNVARWMSKKKVFEELSLQIEKINSFQYQALIAKFKLLHEDLKYAFSGSKKTFIVVISTYLDENQVEHLISVLCKYK